LAEKMREKILVVDDEENIRHLLRLAFEADFEVVEAGDGAEALEKAIREKPDLILSDIMMPRLDGYGLYRKIRSRPETASVPFIFLSAKKDVDERVVGLEMGADDYITKPFSIKELKARIRSLTRKFKELDERGSLKGLLREVDLVDIIQLVEMGRKTGMLQIESPLGDGRIFFEEGLPVFAEVGKWTGVDAFIVLLSLKEGRFRLDQQPVPIKANIALKRSQELLMEGVRLADEMREAQRHLPSPDTVLAPGEGIPKPAENEELALVVSTFEGGKTLEEVTRAQNLPPFRFFPLVREALSGGYLKGPTDEGRKIDLLRKVRQVLEKL